MTPHEQREKDAMASCDKICEMWLLNDKVAARNELDRWGKRCRAEMARTMMHAWKHGLEIHELLESLRNQAWPNE